MLAISGTSSAIVTELLKLLPSDEEIRNEETVARTTTRRRARQHESRPGNIQTSSTTVADSAVDLLAPDRWLFCAGMLTPERGMDQTGEEVAESIRVNFTRPMEMCDRIFAANALARVCIVGSESGFRGSFDDIYAIAKAGIHAYVRRKRLPWPDQQLVAVAPSIIGDAGMTLRRTDVYNLNRIREAHPKGRFLQAAEVARMIHFLLYVDEGYTTGTVIRMHGRTEAA